VPGDVRLRLAKAQQYWHSLGLRTHHHCTVTEECAMPAVVRFGLGTSLEKFFTTSAVPGRTSLALSGLRGEMLAFQVVHRAREFGTVRVCVEGATADWCTVRRVDLAHVEHRTYGEDEAALIGQSPGFFPDPLMPSASGRAFPDQTRAHWVTVRIPEDAKGGSRKLRVRVDWRDASAAEFSVTLRVVPVALPQQQLQVIHWFHNDCLMSQYAFDAWSPAHWQMAERYLRNAVEHGVNVMTTPLFTPPLDTAIGTERPTVQLIDVTVSSPGVYAFSFRRLGRWIDLCHACGVTHFELSHLSTQWGANHAPKIIGTVDNRDEMIFGWADSSTGDAYKGFLLQFLPKLVRYLRRKGVLANCYLHVSDEPNLDHLPQYKAVRAILREGAPEIPVLEALSDFAFYGEGLVERPCPATNHAQPFLDHHVPNLWTYYCCGQMKDVANRFMDYPSARNRVLGWQLFKFGFEGFLQWGYNHWYEGLTDRLIDPFSNSHADRPLPPGDGFVVYPGAAGPIDSLRWEVFREGLQDMRALRLLQALAGGRPTKAVKPLLSLPGIRSLTRYPRSDNWLLGTREKVNAAIARLS
jgi:hypothetical protein